MCQYGGFKEQVRTERVVGLMVVANLTDQTICHLPLQGRLAVCNALVKRCKLMAWRSAVSHNHTHDYAFWVTSCKTWSRRRGRRTSVSRSSLYGVLLVQLCMYQLHVSNVDLACS